MNRTLLGVTVAVAACSSSGKPQHMDVEETAFRWHGATPLTWRFDGLGVGGKLEAPAQTTPQELQLKAVRYTPDDTTPEKARVIGKVYELTPVGATFDPAAKLTLILPSGALVNPVLATAQTGDTKWTELPSTRTTSEISAPVSHFSLFALVQASAANQRCLEWHGNATDNYPFCLQLGGVDRPGPTGCPIANVIGRCFRSTSDTCELGYTYDGGQPVAQSQGACEGGGGRWLDGPP